MSPTHLRLVAAVLAALLAGCRTPLQQYIIDHDYEPFAIPREADGVGTVITFERGREITLARESECLPGAAAAARSAPRRVALETTQYALRADDRLELDLPRVIQEGIDLRAALGHDRVREVRIKLIEPFEMLVSIKTIADALEDLEGTCRQLVLSDGHYVIMQVLGARGIEYEFLDARGTAITLDATLLETIGANAELRHRVEGTRTLDVDFSVLVGYRLVEATELPGLDYYQCRPVSVSEIRRLKQAPD